MRSLTAPGYSHIPTPGFGRVCQDQRYAWPSSPLISSPSTNTESVFYTLIKQYSWNNMNDCLRQRGPVRTSSAGVGRVRAHSLQTVVRRDGMVRKNVLSAHISVSSCQIYCTRTACVNVKSTECEGHSRSNEAKRDKLTRRSAQKSSQQYPVDVH